MGSTHTHRNTQFIERLRPEEKGRILFEKGGINGEADPNLRYGSPLYVRERETETERERQRDLGSVFKEITESMVGQSIIFTNFLIWRQVFVCNG